MRYIGAGCAGGNDDAAASPSPDTSTDDPSSPAPDASEDPQPTGAEVALLIAADSSIEDRGFNQSTWEGIEAFCAETGHTYAYYQPTETSQDALIEATELAVLNGAEVIVVAGASFVGLMEPLFEAFPDLLFICNELPNTTPAENAVVYSFRPEEAAFLAGVAMVYEGYTKIGYIGGQQIIPVLRAGYGFIEGVNWAAGALGVEGVELKYWYANSFAPSPDIQTFAAAWYQTGTEVIAAWCGGAGASIWAAAEGNDGLVIGCDTDQYFESETILTSTLKLVNVSVTAGLEAWEAGTFPSGETISFGLSDGGVSLAMEHARLERFTEDIYEDYRQQFLDGEMGELIPFSDAETPVDLWNALDTHNIDFQYVE